MAPLNTSHSLFLNMSSMFCGNLVYKWHVGCLPGLPLSVCVCVCVCVCACVCACVNK